MKVIIYLLFVTLIFIVWVEYSIGNILFRISECGKNQLNISSLFYFMLHPLKDSFLWNWELLDTNYIFILILSLIIYLRLKFKIIKPTYK